MHGIHSRRHRRGELAPLVDPLVPAGRVDEDDAGATSTPVRSRAWCRRGRRPRRPTTPRPTRRTSRGCGGCSRAHLHGIRVPRANARVGPRGTGERERDRALLAGSRPKALSSSHAPNAVGNPSTSTRGAGTSPTLRTRSTPSPQRASSRVRGCSFSGAGPTAYGARSSSIGRSASSSSGSASIEITSAIFGCAFRAYQADEIRRPSSSSRCTASTSGCASTSGTTASRSKACRC